MLIFLQEVRQHNLNRKEVRPIIAFAQREYR